MSTNYVKPAPGGINPPLPHEQQPVIKVYTGDRITIETTALLRDGTLATPENSILEFGLADDRFCDPFWVGRWRAGIEVIATRPGLIIITIPDEISATLRRGSFSWSLMVADKFGADRRTVVEGWLLVEYAVTSPIQSIPYKDNQPAY